MNVIIFKVKGNTLTRVGGVDPASAGGKQTRFRFLFDDKDWKGVTTATVTQFFDIRESKNIIISDTRNGVAECELHSDLRAISGVLWVGITGVNPQSGQTLDCVLTAVPVGHGGAVSEVISTKLYLQFLDYVLGIKEQIKAIEDKLIDEDNPITTSLIQNLAITPEKLDRKYWEKISPVDTVIKKADDLFNVTGFLNEGGSIAFLNVDVTVNIGEDEVELSKINGFCYAVGLKFESGDTVYLINVTDGSIWKLNRYNEGSELIPLYKLRCFRLKADEKGIAENAVSTEKLKDGCVTDAKIKDSSVTPEKLDRKYLEKSVTQYGESVTTFAELVEKVGFYVNRGGNLCFVNLNVTDNANDTITNYGYIEGDFIAVGSLSSGSITLINLVSGEFWVLNKIREKYIATKIEGFKGRIEYLEKNAKLKVNVDFNTYNKLAPVYDEDILLYQCSEEDSLKSISFKDFRGSLDYVCISLESLEELYGANFKQNKKYLIYCDGGLASHFSSTYCEATLVGSTLTVIPVNNVTGYYIVDLEEKTCVYNSRPVAEGSDGYSPTAAVTQNDSGATITITDKDGTTTATVVNGKDGQDGYTPVKGVDYFDGKDGADGKNGVDGENGTSVTILSVRESTEDSGNNVVNFSDGKTLTVKNGAKGEKGEKGNSGVYIGSGDMPEDCNVQIDPTGEAVDLSEFVTKEYVDNAIENIETGGASGSGSSETLVFEHKWENHIAHTVTAIDFENFTMTLDDATGIPTDTTGKPQSYIQLDMFGGNAILMNVVPIELINKGFKVQAIGDNKVQFLDNSNTVIQFTDTGNIDLTKFKLCVLDKPFSLVNVDNLDINHKYHAIFDFEGFHHHTANIRLPECVPAVNNGYKIEGLRSIQQHGYYNFHFNAYNDTISFRNCGEGVNGFMSATLPAKLDVYITPELYNGQKRALVAIKGVYYSHSATKYDIASYCVYAKGWTNNAISKIGFGAGNANWHGNAKARIYDCGEVDLW